MTTKTSPRISRKDNPKLSNFDVKKLEHLGETAFINAVTRRGDYTKYLDALLTVRRLYENKIYNEEDYNRYHAKKH